MANASGALREFQRIAASSGYRDILDALAGDRDLAQVSTLPDTEPMRRLWQGLRAQRGVELLPLVRANDPPTDDAQAHLAAQRTLDYFLSLTP